MTDFFKHLITEFELPLSNPILVFSLILFIILLSPIVLKRLNIPGIIGLIISGIIIGPFGLNFLEKNSAVDLFSTIGLLYIMFIAGLELDMNEFKTHINKSLLFGLFTFIFPLAIGFPVCYYLLGYDFNASLLTAGMFSTHTLVAYPIVSKLGISKNQVVAITVGGTILTDTAVLIMLAVIMGNSQGNFNQDFFVALGVSLVIFSAIMFFIIPRIVKWFFQKLESEKHAHYILVLSVVFFAAFLAKVAGLEPIIGAFMAGLALNRLIPHSSALMNRIEFIGNSLFIPFFLISVGMMIDVSVILSGKTALIVAGTLSVTALFGKWFAAFITRLIFRYSKAQQQLIFGLSCSRVAAALAIILVGYKAGILDENILNGTIILILITCIVASFVTEKAAKKIVISDENSELHTSGSVALTNEHILVPISDFSNIDKLLEFALLIKGKKSANPVSILSVVPNNKEAEFNIIKSRNKLEEYVRQASASEIKVNVIATIDHNTASGIVRISREIMADIIVLEWPQHSTIINKLIGEKVDSIVTNTDKTVLIGHFNSAMVVHKRMFIVAPPLSEHEYGFELWFSKMAKLAQEMSIPILFYSNKNTEEAIRKQLRQYRINTTITFKFFDDWEDFFILSGEIRQTDLFVLVSARKGSVSFMSMLEALPSKTDKYFTNNSRIVIYPQQYNRLNKNEGYEDISSGPLTKGIEAIEKIGKGIGDIFKK